MVAWRRSRSRASESGTYASLMPWTAVDTTDGAASRTNRFGLTWVPAQKRRAHSAVFGALASAARLSGDSVPSGRPSSVSSMRSAPKIATARVC